MAMPTITGYTDIMANGSGATFTVNPNANRNGSVIALGDWMIMIIVAGTGTGMRIPSITGDWTVLHPFGQVGSGTMSVGVWARICDNPAATYTFNQTVDTHGTYSRFV